MEYVGRRVKKEFQGQGTFFGLVQEFEPATGFFKIVYDDGDSEEMDLMEISSLLVSTEPPPPPPQPSELPAGKPGRKPKKRRIRSKSQDTILVNEGTVCDSRVDRERDSAEFDLNLNERLDLNDDAYDCLHDDDGHGRNVLVGGADLHALDLNEGVNLELDEGLGSSKKVIDENEGVKKEMIDLNLDVNGDLENLSDKKEGQRFDLNLQLVEDEVSILEDCGGQFVAIERVCARGDVLVKEELMEDDRVENLVNVEEHKADLVVSKEDSQLKNCVTEAGDENVAPVSVQPKRRGRKRKNVLDNRTELATSQALTVGFETRNMDLDDTPSNNVSDSVDHDNGDSEVVLRGRRGRKRKELADKDITLITPETGLRRSSRRAKTASFSAEDQESNAAGLEGINYQLSSPAISIVSDEKIIVAAQGKSRVDEKILPPKVELPPPSCNIYFDGVSSFDFLSVYTFLRSFSTLLFLSPFELDVFVASVRSNDSTLLFDSVHVALLRTLRKHLMSLSDEGSSSASDCLRSLNWDFLDLITWPNFVVEYLLLHSPGNIPGLDLCQLKLFQNDYYRLPIAAKLEILRHLCDDVIETEAFRSELNKRVLPSDRLIDLERSTKIDSTRKRKSVIDVASTSCITEEDAEETEDWNSDECCLCKMDGSLICCDGCPAAFHSRCVGVLSNLLPEGDWYCPECVIEKDNPGTKLAKAIRGSELLDIDPYGRLYYSCYGYLLVLESCNDKYLSFAYSRNDLPTLIEALESSPCVYDLLISAICKHWNVVRRVGGTKNYLDTHSCSIQSAILEKRQLPDVHLTSSETLNRNEAFSGKSSDGKCMVTAYSSNTEHLNAEHARAALEGNHGSKLENQLASSEGSPEVSQTSIKTDNLKESVPDSTLVCHGISEYCHIPEKLVNAGGHYMNSTTVNVEKGKNLSYKNHRPDTLNSNVEVLCGTNYINHYEFARTASSYYEEWTRKSLDKTSQDAPRSVEEVISGQLKVVTNRFAEFSWSNIQNSNIRKEKCGWCFYCRAADEDRDCLFCMNDSIPLVESFTCEALGIGSRKNVKNHLTDVMCHIICIEDHLQGLLLGPWLNPGFSMLWRKSVLEAADIASVKNLLLKLESNLHHLAFSADWRKHVDSVATMGSASYIFSTSARASSKYGIDKKKAKLTEVNGPSSNAATGLSLFWWRGGRCSRALFNWKVLPRSLACKAARQGGRKKIPDILYPDSGEYAKRIKYASWRAAVETSRSVEQLALQIRELDANIRWDDIGNNNLLSKIERDSKKPVRSFKKVIVRRKCSEKAVVKYLLDFGKRRFIPDVVVRHGSRIEDSSSEKKKYWLEEAHVPLHLLKAFEEKRIARKSNNMKSEKLREEVKRSCKDKGFSYLFSRAEKMENYQCGHCKKDVPVREAVSCQHCEGSFHKRHVRRSAGSITIECKYTCHNCHDGKIVKIDTSKGKSIDHKLKDAPKGLKLYRSGKGKKRGRKKRAVNSKNTKRLPLVPLRRSARNADRNAKLSLQNTKSKKRKKGKRAKTEKGKFKKPKTSSWKKERTPVISSYWMNGLRLARKPDDERLMHFRSRALLVCSGVGTSISDKPNCSLCSEPEHKPQLNYVGCEICGDWFHGDALDLTADKIENLIGFKCYRCLKKKPPVCPQYCSPGSEKHGLVSDDKSKTECAGKESDCLTHLEDGSAHQKSFLNDNSKDNMTVDMERQLPGSVPESNQDNDLTWSKKNLLETDSIALDGKKEEVLNSLETQSTIPNSDNNRSKDIYMTVDMERQLPGSVPESNQDNDFTMSGKILLVTDSIALDEKKEEVLNSVETQSTTPNSDMAKEAEYSPLMHDNLVKNGLTDQEHFQSVAADRAF